MLLLLALLAETAAAPGGLAFREETAIIYGNSREPIFRASRDFALKLGGNPKGKIFDIDILERRVKISAGGEGLWVSCNALQPGLKECDRMPQLTVKRRSGAARSNGSGSGPSERGLPSCPGDPRCPNGG